MVEMDAISLTGASIARHLPEPIDRTHAYQHPDQLLQTDQKRAGLPISPGRRGLLSDGGYGWLGET